MQPLSFFPEWCMNREGLHALERERVGVDLRYRVAEKLERIRSGMQSRVVWGWRL